MNQVYMLVRSSETVFDISPAYSCYICLYFDRPKHSEIDSFLFKMVHWGNAETKNC